MRIEGAELRYDDLAYRTPMTFGARTVDHITVLNVEVAAAAANGQRAVGHGAMTLANVWSWPALAYEQSLTVMKAHAEKIRVSLERCGLDGDPFLFHTALAPEWQAMSGMPPLAAAVTTSAFDWALHDAYGKLRGRHALSCWGPEVCSAELERLLGSEFAGESLARYVLSTPRGRVSVYHTVGGRDPLTRDAVMAPVGDGGPECLADWIARDGLRRFKIKLGAGDVDEDVARLLAVHDVVARELRGCGASEGLYALDFNETCPDAAYLLEFLREVRGRRPGAFAAIELLEQPTPRDLVLAGDGLASVARLKPVIADESVLDADSLRKAREMGYGGVALKAGKGLSASLLTAAAAQKWGMTLAVMDLTCPGASFVESATLASRIPGVRALEANARQYLREAAHGDWVRRAPDLFRPSEGMVRTAGLTAPGTL